MSVPAQRNPDATPCQHCGELIHLVNTQLGPQWRHVRGGYEWCLKTRAEPVLAEVAR